MKFFDSAEIFKENGKRSLMYIFAKLGEEKLFGEIILTYFFLKYIKKFVFEV